MAKILDNFIDHEIGKRMLANANARDADHKISGKLAASRLGDPLQWQVLSALGAIKDPLDEYIVRKFERGHHVESWVLQYFTCDTLQEQVEYRGVVGRMDAMADTKGWDFDHGIVPIEIKSVANAKFRRIVGYGGIPGNGPDKGHILQAVLYGLAKDVPWVVIAYVASDDYRVQPYWIKVEDYKNEVDVIIDKFNGAIGTETIPVFMAKEKWQENPKYNKYNDWAAKTEKELKVLSKKLFKSNVKR